jgi:FkbH-like protein
MMEFQVTFDDPSLLAEAPGRSLTGSLPRLRFLNLLPPETVAPILDALPAHLAARVTLDPGPAARQRGVQAILTRDPSAARAVYTNVAPENVVDWTGLADRYAVWLADEHARRQEAIGPLTPDGLYPLGFTPEPTTLEILGSCQAQALFEAAEALADLLPGTLRTVHTVQVIATPTPPAEPVDATIFPLPVRLLGDLVLDDVTLVEGAATLAARAVEILHLYLESAVAPRPHTPVFVLGALCPAVHPEGAFFHEREASNFAHFIRLVNEEAIAWCAGRSGTYYVDLDAISAGIGKAVTDEGSVGWFAHRGTADPTMNVLRRLPLARLNLAVLRLVRHQLLTISGVAQVKAVIVDLDNTLFNGIATDLALGPWEGRHAGLVEALLLLKRRGIFLAIASKNDETFIREHWERLLGEYAASPLSLPLHLEDFDVVKIDFRPKSTTIGEILRELNIGEDAAVFIDDNALEREEVQSRFPALRILGAELDSVRDELLFSPFTDRHVRLAEDALRSATVATQSALQRELASGSAEDFLASLGLEAVIEECTSPIGATAQRAVQLINKTNQWNLNGARISEADFATALGEGARCLVCEVHDRSNEFGIVAVVLVDPVARRVSHMVISCRVIGMGIDDAIAAFVAQRFGEICWEFAPTGRNKATEAFFARHLGAVPSASLLMRGVEVPSHVTLHSAVAVAV